MLDAIYPLRQPLTLLRQLGEFRLGVDAKIEAAGKQVQIQDAFLSFFDNLPPALHTIRVTFTVFYPDAIDPFAVLAQTTWGQLVRRLMRAPQVRLIQLCLHLELLHDQCVVRRCEWNHESLSEIRSIFQPVTGQQIYFVAYRSKSSNYSRSRVAIGMSGGTMGVSSDG